MIWDRLIGRIVDFESADVGSMPTPRTKELTDALYHQEKDNGG